MLSKSYYRDLLRKYQTYVKLSVLAKEFGINQSNLSMFMKGESFDYCISTNKLNDFVAFIDYKISNL